MDGALQNPALKLDIGGRSVPVTVRRSARARRISLRIDTATHTVILVLPKRATLEAGLRFAGEKTVWLQNRLAVLPAPVSFARGVSIPLRGAPHRIRHRPDSRAGVWLEDGEIHVSGAEAHLPRRLTDWLKAEARREITPRARDKAVVVDLPVARVSVREARSRWGSCSSAGNLSFSWRLILAPEIVLDYVVAHEVAHLVHMNHGEDFWALCATLTPRMEEAKTWLRRHGNQLHRYG
ncbi:MAG: SprT family zinc-dependent metalloprotease [Pseudomonadota bacterium]